ncbi:hypothetical protein [Vibrio jasicida]|uniref:hypothetical protein n=1 Tax=Vibrio jasicida TaxID=766224 RepID=UPI0005EDF79C|nr:hypothetical protein [Vibrio jasicida]
MDNDNVPIPKENTIYRSKLTNKRFYIFDVTELSEEDEGELYLVTVVLEEEKDDLWAIGDELAPEEWAFFYAEQQLELAR